VNCLNFEAVINQSIFGLVGIESNFASGGHSPFHGARVAFCCGAAGAKQKNDSGEGLNDGTARGTIMAANGLRPFAACGGANRKSVR
jgi:hypothetical protein